MLLNTSCFGVSFLIRLKAFTSIKRDSGTGFFLRILENLYEQLFCRISANDCLKLDSNERTEYIGKSNLRHNLGYKQKTQAF